MNGEIYVCENMILKFIYRVKKARTFKTWHN